MKTTGMVRQLDSLGRVVLPIELRRSLDINTRDMLEILVEGSSIILRKYETNCLFCGGKGCPTCGDGWIELIPCGLVHPQVLRFGGVDPREYSGFAFGVGLTRLAMMKYGIRDIRYLNCGDLRVNEQFSVLA